jgi:beta-lactamase class D
VSVTYSTAIFIFAFTSIVYGCAPDKRSVEDDMGSPTNELILRDDFKQFFDSCGVDGSVAIYDVKNQKWFVSDTLGINQETLPASSFKIMNLLIALETQTIRDENEVVRWMGRTDTVKYGYRPDIYKDMSVKEAFETSAGWVFVELAKKIGKEEYQAYLKKCNYGNNRLNEQDADFWNFGDFAISPRNQVEFVNQLYQETLPFSKKNMAIVKQVMLSEQTDAYTLRAKTGWTRANNINTGWWTGYLETEKGTYIFATRLLQDRNQNRSDFGTCRKDITKKVFKELGILEEKSSP